MKQHYLGSYRQALVAVLRAQFCPVKAFEGGRAGAGRLADNAAVHAYLCHAGTTCTTSNSLAAPSGRRPSCLLPCRIIRVQPHRQACPVCCAGLHLPALAPQPAERQDAADGSSPGWTAALEVLADSPLVLLRWPYMLLSELCGGTVGFMRALLGCVPAGADERITGSDGSAGGEGEGDVR